jgi:Tol biopolymer transport system component
LGNERSLTVHKAFGGDEDYLWSPDSKKILYVKRKEWQPFHFTSIFEYSLETGLTTNRTEVVMTLLSNLTWLQMKRKGMKPIK